jgi:hypothetical protein
LRFTEILHPEEDDHLSWQQVYLIWACRDRETEAGELAGQPTDESSTIVRKRLIWTNIVSDIGKKIEAAVSRQTSKKCSNSEMVCPPLKIEYSQIVSANIFFS